MNKIKTAYAFAFVLGGIALVAFPFAASASYVTYPTPLRE